MDYELDMSCHALAHHIYIEDVPVINEKRELFLDVLARATQWDRNYSNL